MGGSGGGGSIDEGGKQTGRVANPFKGPASRTRTLNPISEPEFGNPNPGFESLKPNHAQGAVTSAHSGSSSNWMRISESKKKSF